MSVASTTSVSRQTFYGLKAKHGGMTTSYAQGLKTLEDENRWLKKLLAEFKRSRTAAWRISNGPALIESTLTEPGGAMRIARAAQECVLNGYTYIERARRLIDHQG